jgi:thiol-disulfide isomerase/thioredoxin
MRALEARQMGQDPNGWKTLLTRANQLFRATTHPAALLPVEGRMPSLDGATGWLNSPSLTAADLRGHVVLVNFWTYTCINWLRTLAYVRAWAERYKDRGLIVIGVHTPEFDFERDPDNVRRAVKDLKVDVPVAVDSDYAIWNAFGNRYWPAFYFVDAQGQIRHHRFGEGEYEQSEMILQHLLTEAGASGADQDLVSVAATGVEAAADWDSLWSPENYLGYQRTENFASSNGAVLDTPHAYAAPERLRLNHWALSGDWTVQRQATVLRQPEGRIVYRFHARDLHLVMGPATPETPVRFRIRLDGQPPGAAHGTDVDDQGDGTATEPRLYQLVRQPGPVTERTFEATFLDPGVHAYAFTFG